MDSVDYFIRMSFRAFSRAADDRGLVEELMGVFIGHNLHFDAAEAVRLYRRQMQMPSSGTVPLVAFEMPKSAQ